MGKKRDYGASEGSPDACFGGPSLHTEKVLPTWYMKLDSTMLRPSIKVCQLILWLASGVSNEGGSSPLSLGPLAGWLFLGPGFRLGARWNRLDKTVKTRKKTGENGGKMGEIF